MTFSEKYLLAQAHISSLAGNFSEKCTCYSMTFNVRKYAIDFVIAANKDSSLQFLLSGSSCRLGFKRQVYRLRSFGLLRRHQAQQLHTSNGQRSWLLREISTKLITAIDIKEEYFGWKGVNLPQHCPSSAGREAQHNLFN